MPERGRALVLVDRLPRAGWPSDDAETAHLVGAMARLLGPGRLTVAAPEAPLAARPPWCDAAEVVTGGVDWAGWFATRRFSFDLVVVTGPGVMARWAELLRRTQPQALLAATLEATWSAQRTRTVTPLRHVEERRGAEATDQLISSYDRSLLADADLLLASQPMVTLAGALAADAGVEVLVLPPVVGHPGETPDFDDRPGIALLASMASGFADPGEKAAHSFAEHIVPTLRRRGFAGPAWLVAHRAYPATRRLRGVDLEPATRARAVLLASRIAVGHPSDPGAAVAAARSGAVFVALDESPRRTADTISELSESAEAWAGARDGQVSWADANDDRNHLAVVAGVLRRAGLLPEEAPSPLDLGGPVVREWASVGRSFQGQVQTLGLREHRAMDRYLGRTDLPPELLVPRSGYEWWFGAHSFGEPQRAALRTAQAAFAYRPLVSIVMPTYNTDAEVLSAAVASVQDQVYDNWQLCIADDASTAPETRDVLTELGRTDERIEVVFLEDNRGIAGASIAAVELARGEFLALLDHDDTLLPEALFEVVALLNEVPDLDFVYSDEDKLDREGHRVDPFFKPSWSPDLLTCVNYVTHFAVYRRAAYDRAGGFRPGYDGSQDYDLALRVAEVTDRVGHVAKPLYSWRMVEGSAAEVVDAKPYAVEAARRALSDALRRRGYSGRVESGRAPGTWRMRYEIPGEPLVSIVIPTRNRTELLDRCVTSIRERTSYGAYEIVVIDNQSDEPEALEYLRAFKGTVVSYPFRFNYARQMNLGIAASRGDLVLLLNNDMEVVEEGWLEAMVEHACRSEVGAVGARLFFPDGRVQHEGVFVGYGGGTAGNVDFGDYFALGRCTRNSSAVTAACMMSRREVLTLVGGFDERLRVAFNDVDLCLRIRQHGYRIVVAPDAVLVHAESASRGSLHPQEDEEFFGRRWGGPDDLADPFYNPNLDPIRPWRMVR